MDDINYKLQYRYNLKLIFMLPKTRFLIRISSSNYNESYGTELLDNL